MLDYSDSKRNQNRPPSAGRPIENRSKSSSDLGKMGQRNNDQRYYYNNYLQPTFPIQQDHSLNTQENTPPFAIGWGRNANNQYHTTGLSAVSEVACGEKHTLYIKGKYELYGCGDNRFGQLGCGQQEYIDEATVVFKGRMVSNVYCGPYHSFFITSKGEVWATGMNNRGQLGIGNDQDQKIPVLVQSISPSTGIRRLTSKQGSRGRIVTVHNVLVERQNSNENNIMQNQYTPEKRESRLSQSSSRGSDSLLEEGEYIKSIACGPFHSLVLTTKGRVFASGIRYHCDMDEYSTQFVELRLRIGHIEQISCGTVLNAALTTEGRAYIWGVFGKKHFSEPTLVDLKHVIQISLGGQYMNICLNSKGEVYQLEQDENFLESSTSINSSKFPNSIIKTSRVEGLPICKTIQTGVNFALVITQAKQVYGWGKNKYGQIEKSKTQFYDTPVLVRGANDIQKIASGSYHVVGLTQRQPAKQTSTSQKDLEVLQMYKLQNQELKANLKKREKRSVKVQTDPMTKFDMPSGLTTTLQPRTFSTSLQIPFQELVLQKQISEGGYGIIYKAKWRQTTVAVKLFKIDNSQSAVKDFLSQCHAMEALRHPNIVMFLGACTKPPHLAIVLEYCSKGTLWSILQSSVDLSWEDRRRFAMDTARGMNYLHSSQVPILHRDLKSLNLLLDQSYRVKLADFGWTKGLENYMTSKIGTYQWMAPEVISGQKYTEKADVFSYAIILWEIASREPPYRSSINFLIFDLLLNPYVDVSGLQVSIEVANNDLRPTIPKKTPENFTRLIKRCWDRNPDLRPSFREIIKQLQTMKLA